MDKDKLLLEQWKMASELHRHEDNLIWQRFSYFVTLTGILASGLGVVLTADTLEPKERYLSVVIISFFWASVSWAFSSIFRRAYLYHLHRIDQAKKAEEELLISGERILTVYGTGLQKETLGVNRFSWFFAHFKTGDIIFSLSIFVAIVWMIAFFCGLQLRFEILDCLF